MSDLSNKIIILLIRPELNRTDVEELAEYAVKHECGGVLLQPHYIETAHRLLKDSHVKTIALIGSPNGGTTTATKMYEAQDAIRRGADEIAMMAHLPGLRDHDDLVVRNDIASVAQTARGRNVTLILDDVLSVEEKTRACKIAQQVRIAFVQTSLGASMHELTLANVKMLHASSPVPIVASGKAISSNEAAALFDAGAVRIAVCHPDQLLK